MTATVKITEVSKSFGATRALDRIDLEIRSREIFGLIGPDGAGKTTLFRMITSLLLPDSGTIRVLGYDIIKDYKRIRKLIGYMPGRFSLYQDLTVEENLKFYATVFGTTIQENYHLIEDIYSHIAPFRNRLARNLSGGMKQKLALSCALIHRPRLLILDEPTTGVDAVSRREFWDMLKKIRDEGITVLVSTPYMDEAMQCERVAFLQNGAVLAMGTPQEIIASYRKDIISVRSRDLYKLVMDLRYYPGAVSALLFGQEVHFASESGQTDMDHLRGYLLEKGHQEVDLKPADPTIEDTFLDLMQEKKQVG